MIIRIQNLQNNIRMLHLKAVSLQDKFCKQEFKFVSNMYEKWAISSGFLLDFQKVL
jgi:hypothetical protein